MDRKIGRYEIRSLLGRGGMASVYLAHDPNFDRDVALKALPREFMHDTQFIARFLREAKAIASLEHTAIVPVHDFGEDDGQPYIVMRFMPGGSLEDRLKLGPLTVEQATAVVRRIALALQAAHEKGVVHRDLKPGNILFDQYNNAYLADFGIAKVAQASATLTGAGVIGTPAYMSPEQALAKATVGPPSDQYSLGIILFQMLTGEMPFKADTPVGQALAHVNDPVPSMRTVHPATPDWLEAIITRSLAKAPEARFKTVVDMAEAMEKGNKSEATILTTRPAEVSAAVSQPPALPPQPPPAKPAAAKPKIPLWLLAGGGVLIALICIAAAAVFGPGLLGSGAQPTEAAVVVSEPAQTNTPAPSPTPTQTPSPTPTSSPTPTRTPSPTATQTPEPLQALFTARQNLFCREGPGPEFLDVYIVANTRSMPALARWENDWILLGVDDPAITRTHCCWVDLQGELNVELESLELISTLPDRVDCPYFP